MPFTKKESAPPKKEQANKEKVSGDAPRRSPARRKSPGRTDPPRNRSPTKKSEAKTPTKSKSPARQSPKKSPARPRQSASPARKRSSPARRPAKPKTPERTAVVIKSPKELIKEKPITERKRSPGRSVKALPTKEVIYLTESESDSETSEVSKGSSMRLRSRKTPSTKEDSIEIVNNVRRQPTAQKNEFERVVHLKSNYEPIAKLTEFSDEDELQIKPHSVELSRSIKSKTDHKDALKAAGHLLTVFITFFGLLLVCNDRKCALEKPQLSTLAHIASYFDPFILLTFIGYLLFVMVMSLIPVGRRCSSVLERSGKINYMMNGLFSAIIILSLVFGIRMYGLPVGNFLLKNFFKFAVSSLVVSLPIGLLLFVKQLNLPISCLNKNALKNSSIYKFVYGCENNPRFFGIIDVKMIMFRSSCYAILAVLGIVMFKSLAIPTTFNVKNYWDILEWIDAIKEIKYNTTLLVFSTLMFIYLIDIFLFEYAMTTSAVLQYESFGYVNCLECAMFMTFYGLLPKYIHESKVVLETWLLAVLVGIYLVGFVLYRGSNLQKHAFRQNPYSPSVAHLESIPTSLGKKLICSGYWGLVRHPNYLGDILINISLLPFVLKSPLFLVILFTIFGLVERARRDNNRCKERYGAAWERYCQRVPYILVPKVY